MMRLRIRIHFSFYPAVLYFLISGGAVRFFTMVLLVLVHEAGHAAAALALGLKAEEITVMPVGQRLTVREIYSAERLKRAALFTAGPLMSFLLAAVLYFSGLSRSIAEMSMTLCIINLIPVLPLDGGGIAMTLLGGIVGDMRAAKVMLKFSKLFSRAITVFGFIWIVLYPYNLDFVVAGLFLDMINNVSSPGLYSGILKALLKPSRNRVGRINYIFAGKNSEMGEILSRMKTDRRNVVVVIHKGKPVFIDQNKICAIAMRNR